MWSSELRVTVEQVVLSGVAEAEYTNATEDEVDKEFQRDEGMLTGTGEEALPLLRTAQVDVGGLVEEELMVVEEVVVASELTGASRLLVWGRRHQEDTGQEEDVEEEAGEANTRLECVTRGLK